MINLGLARITNLLGRLPLPSWTAIHIAGTNGKGSVAAYLTAFFLRLSVPKEGDLRIGRFTSPHLIDRWDCITINDSPVSKSLFLSVESEIKSLTKRNELDDSSPTDVFDEETPTEFELLTATAFQIFTQQKCQLAIIECGLGGRLDATNALRPSDVVASVITKIGLDHQNLLGDTIEAIACEKAGIIKEGHLVVIDGSNLSSVKDAIRQTAKDVQGVEFVTTTGDTTKDTARTTASEFPPEIQTLSIPRHQKENLEVSLTAFQRASTRVATLTTQVKDAPKILQQILQDVKHSSRGRLQRLSIAPLVPLFTGTDNEILLDGAHNPQSATVLRQYIDDTFFPPSSSTPLAQTSVTWVIAMSRGKNISEILTILLRPGDKVITCPFGAVDGMPWVKCVEPTDIADVAGSMIQTEVVTCDSITDALRVAAQLRLRSRDGDYEDAARGDRDRNHDSDPVVVAGSLYLVSDLLRTLREVKDGTGVSNHH